MTENTIIITAANEKYFDLVQGTILSIREKPQGKNATLGFFDLGCTPEQLNWLQAKVNIIQQPEWEFDFPNRENTPHYLKGLLARPYLQKYFPNFDIYLWIDADAWVQDWSAIELLIRAASRKKLAIVPELDRGYWLSYGKLPWYFPFVERDYQSAFGEEVAKKLYSFPVLNAGIFALHKDAPHWEVWAKFLHQGLQNYSSLMTDQITLNLIVYGAGLFDKTEMLPAWCNWSCNFGLPVWDQEINCLVEPYLPHTPIGIIHLTGHKHDRVKVLNTEREELEVSLRYTPKNNLASLPDSQPTEPRETEILHPFPRGDYVSPGLKVVHPDSGFPDMIKGDTNACTWVYLRREVPHNWYVDKRHPFIGFLSRDEAHILYNLALQFKGKKALEIGCWLGWSACHLALAGVELDIVDPLLDKPEVRQSIVQSLQQVGVLGNVKLFPGYSPQKVEELVTLYKRKWSLIFIDGNHDAPAPLQDAIACEKYAEADAMIVFHDLASPDVAQGLDYLKNQGWNTLVYQTMQIMGIAWRGNVQPLEHEPDPQVNWTLPEHLRHYTVSSKANLKVPAATQVDEFQQILAVIRPYTLLSEARLRSLYTLAKQICLADLPGNFVECGTYKGGATALLAYIIKHYSQRPRTLYACDTFEGMPEPTEVDQHQGIPANATGFGVGTLQAPIAENLEKVCQLLQVRDIVTPVKGLFSQTLPQYQSQIGAIALLHADADWYESTMDIFNYLYDSVVGGGAIQIDDYGHWEGCKQAIHDFERQIGESFNLTTIDYTGVWFEKLQPQKIFQRVTTPPQILIKETSYVSKSALLECRYGGSIYIGNATEILEQVMLLTYGGTIEIGDNCSINPFTVIYGHGGTKIGNNVLIAAHTVIIPSNHNFEKLDKPIRLQGNISKGICIEDDVWIGAGCRILDGVTVGRGSVIAAGAVVNHNIEPFSVVGGVPAKLIKKRN